MVADLTVRVIPKWPGDGGHLGRWLRHGAYSVDALRNYDLRSIPRSHSAFAPDTFMAFAYFNRSTLTTSLSCSGVLKLGSAPIARIRRCKSASSIAVASAAEILAIIFDGVPAGAKNPSSPGKSCKKIQVFRSPRRSWWLSWSCLFQSCWFS